MSAWSRAFAVVVPVLLAVLGLGGALILAFYVPSVKEAWSSVVYLEDAVKGGRGLRGMHGWASHALVLACCTEVVVSVLRGRYAAPYARLFWLRLARLGLVVSIAIAGHALPWDQAGYWARRVELAIVALVPGVGAALAGLVQGGSDLGQLGLSRLFAAHVALLPAALGLLLYVEAREARRLRQELGADVALLSSAPDTRVAARATPRTQAEYRPARRRRASRRPAHRSRHARRTCRSSARRSPARPGRVPPLRTCASM